MKRKFVYMMLTAFLDLSMNQEIFAASSSSPINRTSLFDRAQEKRKIEAKESRQRASDEWERQKATKEKKMQENASAAANRGAEKNHA